MDRQYSFREGMTVYGADGDKVGKVVAVDPSYVVVEKGFFFPTDSYIPATAIATMDAENIYLTVSKDEALNQGWDQPLASSDAGFATDAGAGATAAYAETDAATTDAYETAARGPGDVTGEPFDHTERGRVDQHEADRLRVPVHEEELQATTRERDLGKVRIDKDVVTEERTLDVPVREERVRVSQVSVDRDAPVDDPTAFQEGTIEVPIHGEEVELQKRARVTGEVVVDKEQVQRTERVGGTVRKEQVVVDDETVVTDRDAGTTR